MRCRNDRGNQIIRSHRSISLQKKITKKKITKHALRVSKGTRRKEETFFISPFFSFDFYWKDADLRDLATAWLGRVGNEAKLAFGAVHLKPLKTR